MAGERVALDQLLRRHQNAAHRVAYGIMGEDADAADVVQEAFLHVFAHVHGFRRRSSFKTWLLRIVSNAALRMRQRRSRRQAVEGRDVANYPPVGLRVPLDELLMKELAKEAAVLSLSTDDRMHLIYRRLVEGWNYKEIAGEIGRSRETVRKRVARLRAFLLTELVARGLLP